MVVPPVRFGSRRTPFLGAEIFLRGVLDKAEVGLIGGADVSDVVFVLIPDVPANLTRIRESRRGEFALWKRALLWPRLFFLLSNWYTASLGELLLSLSPYYRCFQVLIQPSFALVQIAEEFGRTKRRGTLKYH